MPEPNRLPDAWDNWADWRRDYDDARTAFVEERLTTRAYVEQLVAMGFRDNALSLEIKEALNQRFGK